MNISPTAIETFTGRAFDYADPKMEDINIRDIAAALSKICRYNGHGVKFYSVAEHCVWLARHVITTGGGEAAALHMLLHDAAEAYIGDHVSPVKQHCPQIRNLEDPIMELIGFKFGIQVPFPEWVKVLDMRILLNEKAFLFPNSRYSWYAEQLGFTELDTVELAGWAPEEAETLYLDMFEFCTGFKVKRS